MHSHSHFHVDGHANAEPHAPSAGRSHHVDDWEMPHQFDEGNPAAERGTRWVLVITLVMMLAEIVAGYLTNSMALLADGWHMSSHAVAIGMAAFAYAMARRHANDARYAWGTWKIEVLGGFASAFALVGVAGMMAWSSVERLVAPLPIHYGEAMWVAAIGLAVNLVCAKILHGAHDHGHGDDHHHHHEHGDHVHHAHGHEASHRDVNLQSAYVHVLTDAMTSVLAIAALAGGSLLGWQWLDPVIGLFGSIVVAVWAIGLLRETSAVLLDREMQGPIVEQLRAALLAPANGGDIEIADLHVWRVGRARYACIVGLVTHRADLQPQQVRGWLKELPALYHVSVEINHCGVCTPQEQG
ncbi:CDF family Co(II)/Ni(II) efflux transporter DmeF [Uliginosibacterium sp. H3]|uniref:CDF family Co(II)/Ni(II) efflux transporter DmeF n=1 Tax=Uliginosibacterium silvisoli TaxID=3114758 RepID=A0ABU6K3M9_9RHOO|nr:CDF family Co(II)/Ni(II) efflux transporter DmeF [Uliginosibacterium sp. H3]